MRLIGLTAVAGLVANLALAQLPSGVTKVASVEGITEYRLQNGLRVLLFPDPGKSTTTVNITYLVGSRHEGYGEKGMAHLLEHMVFKGTPRHADIPKELTEHGTRPNGTTSSDRTNYFESFQATDENLNWALDLESDRMVNSYIAKKDLDSEMTVVRNEFESGENNPFRVLLERVYSTAYLWHNYGMSTIGSRSDIERVPIERLQAFYRNYYQPDNAVLTIAGKLDEPKTLGLVAKYFAGIPRPSRTLIPTYTEEPEQDGERTVTLRRVGDQQVVLMAFHGPASMHPDNAPVNVLAGVLGDAPAGRLYRALVETKKAATAAAFFRGGAEPGLLLATTTLSKEGDLEAARAAMQSALSDLIANPPSEAEVERIKTRLTKTYDLLLADSERVGLVLSEAIAAGDWRLTFVERDNLKKVNVADVARVAKYYLKDSNRTTGLFVPTSTPDRTLVTAAPTAASLVKDYKGNPEMAQGEAFDASPENVDRRTIRGDLKPGVKLAIISKKTRGNSVQALLQIDFGDQSSLSGRREVAALTAAMLTRGTEKYTRQQIADRFDTLKAQVRIGGNIDSADAILITDRQHLTAVLEFVAEVMRTAAFPASEFDLLKQQQLTQLEALRSDPQAQAQRYAARLTNPFPASDPRFVPTLEEQLAATKAVTLDQVKAFYQQFYGASHAELAVVGDVDAEAVQKTVSQSFAGWQSKAPYQHLGEAYAVKQPERKAIETPDKKNAVFLAVLPIAITDESADYPAVTLANYMLGGGFLSSRLATRIRVKDGLSYGIGSRLSIQPKNESGLFQTSAISAPQNSEKVQAAFFDEMERVRKDGFTDAEVAAAKTGWLQGRRVARGQDAELARMLATNAQFGRTMEFQAAVEGKVASLTADQVNQVLRKYFDLSKISTVRAGDFAATASAGGK